MVQQSAILTFPRTNVHRPLISTLIRTFDVEVNILQAHITPEEAGRMFAIFTCSQVQLDRALAYLRENEVEITLPQKNLVWDEQRCVHCGACVGQCMAQAFVVDPGTARVTYNAESCLACELCIPACGYDALASIHGGVC
jgi:ferredoxin